MCAWTKTLGLFGIALGLTGLISSPAAGAQIQTITGKSYVVLNQKTHFYNRHGKKSKKIARKGAGFRIYQVQTKKQIFYETKNHLWLPAKATHGTVWYQESNKQPMILTTNRKGRLVYLLYEPVTRGAKMIVKHNAYVYDRRGLLQRNKKGNVLLLLKGQEVTAYDKERIGRQTFYVTDHGWLKANNLRKKAAGPTTTSKINAKKVKNK